MVSAVKSPQVQDGLERAAHVSPVNLLKCCFSSLYEGSLKNFMFVIDAGRLGCEYANIHSQCLLPSTFSPEMPI